MSTLIAGIDGGQSSTGTVVIDLSSGAIVARDRTGPTDHVGELPNSERAALAVEGSLTVALMMARHDPATRFAAVGIALSGYDGAWHGREPVVAAPVVHVVHDAVAALAGAVDGRPAAVVIAGTGSAAYGENTAGDGSSVGGFGYLFGDAGSSFWIARAALAGAMRGSDRQRESALGAAATAYFECVDLRRIARAVSLNEITRPQLASFARVVHNAARLGDADARAIISQAADDLAELGALVVNRLATFGEGPVSLAFTGGGMNDAAFRSLVSERAAATRLDIRVVPPRFDPAVGAALLACDAAGIPRPELHA